MASNIHSSDVMDGTSNRVNEVESMEEGAIGRIQHEDKISDVMDGTKNRVKEVESVEEGAIGGIQHEDMISDHESDYDPDCDFMITGILTEDDEGNNELHIYPKELAYTDESSADQFHDIIKCIDESQIKTAINKTNIYGKTPLLEFLDDDDQGIVWAKSDVRLKLLNTLLECGSDVNAADNMNMSAVYKIVEKLFGLEDSTEHEILKILLHRGADINKGDIFGRSPVFLSKDPNLSMFLVENGADMSIIDKWERNLLHNAITTSRKDLVEFYLDLLGPDIANKADMFGSTPLHYAAIFKEDESAILIEKGANINAKDNKGQTPLHIAALCGKSDRLDFFISQGGDPHIQDDQGRTATSLLYFPVQLVKQSSINVDKILASDDLSGVINVIDNEDIINSLLHSPGLGGVREEKESQEIKDAVVAFIEVICKLIGHLDNRFTCTMFRTGSSEEGTKVGQPNEFDFVLCLDKFSYLADIVEAEEENGFAVFEAYKEIPNDFINFFDKDNRCLASEVRAVFSNLLRQIVCDGSIWSNPHLYYNGHVRYASDPYRPVFTLNCGWVGTTYKDQFISIDIVPAVRQQGWWPQSTDVTKIGMMSNKIHDEGCLLLFQSFGHFMRISCAPAEICLMKSFPQHVRESYRLCKSLCHERNCPKIGGQTVDDYITSYMLKNSLFHVFEECKKEGLIKEDLSSDLYSYIKQIAIKILRFLAECAKSENLPFYFFHQMEDMFLFEQKEFEDMADSKRTVTDKCKARLAYAKLLLYALGGQL